MKLVKVVIPLILAASLLSGCSQVPQDMKNPGGNIKNEENRDMSNIGFSEFDDDLISYIAPTIDGENYMISPLSFRYAMALATAGATGEAKEELLKAMGFSSLEEYTKWTNEINDIIIKFDESLQRDIRDSKEYGYREKAPDRALKVANSIWHNTNKEGKIKDSYIEYVKNNYNATAENVAQNELVDKINNWVKEQTNGLIPSLVNDQVEESNTVLVNTLYMKSSWTKTFDEHSTKEDDFTTIGGGKVKKEFMHQTDSFAYAEGKDYQLVILPMEGNIKMAIVIGNNENISDKLAKTTYEDVIVDLPKFEVETSYDKKELINYLTNKGVVAALDSQGHGAFEDMIDGADLYIDDIIQKTKIKVDENGTEAAAATAIMMFDTTAMMEPKVPKEFKADRPFSYYIYTDSNNGQELLFFGEVVQ